MKIKNTLTPSRFLLAFLAGAVAACGKSDSPPSGPQTVEAGLITDANKATRLIGGPGATGRVGDFYMQNSKIRVIIQGPGRDVGPSPYGGNIIDADRARDAGETGKDHVGEVSLFLNIGRTAQFTSVTVINDGSRGGPARILATGTDELNDYINLPAFTGLIGYKADTPLNFQIEALYTLEPDETFVRVQYTLKNSSDAGVTPAIGLLIDSGGAVESFRSGLGFGQAAMTDLESLIQSTTATTPYIAHVTSGMAYGLFPNLAARQDGTFPRHVALSIAGVTATVFDTDDLLSAVNISRFTVPANGSLTYELIFIVGVPDLAAVDAVVSRLRSKTTGRVTGRVIDSATDAGRAGLRIAVFDSTDAGTTVFDSDALGNFSGVLPTGSYRFLAEGVPSNAGVAVTVTGNASTAVDLTVPPLGTVPYTIVDSNDAGIAARISFIGSDPSPTSQNHREAFDGPATGIAAIYRTLRGTSDLDGLLLVKPGTYKVVVSRGNEYSLCTTTPYVVDAGLNAPITCQLTRVLDTTGYVAADFHQHTLNSPDSPVPLEDRVKSYLAEGTEFFASSDHDVITDYTSVIAALGVQDLIKFVPGVETTPFDYGHFNGYPLTPNPAMPSNGAPDWGGGTGLNKLPADVFVLLRDAGARVVQVNHPRANPGSTGLFTFQAYFDRAALTFDFTYGVAWGNDAGQPVPNSLLRLPGESLWSADFDAVEVYNGYSSPSSNPDGLGRDTKIDTILRDWFNFLSIGKVITIVGTSDTHKLAGDPGGFPRTYVRVANDTVAALSGESVIDGILAHDAIVTNGPFVEFWAGASKADGGMGRLVPTVGGAVEVHVKAQVPSWMDIAQIEFYVNNTYPASVDGGVPSLVPTFVVAVVTDGGADPDAGAIDAGMTVVANVVPVGASSRIEAEATVNIVVDAGGKDAWVVAVVRGRTILFPVVPDNIQWATTDYVNGTPTSGVRPIAITNAILLDLNGNGVYNAPYKP
ncbi:MAG: CehA/McbA family metallohydrolase [Deltaproteobacteria bacterium]|nr:CehA/McbA family metallohydrolase [Deltaproteobacteria bacterium]